VAAQPLGTGEEFLALLKAQAAMDTSKPHPWPIETFLGSHPNARKFVQDAKPVPASFATESFYGNNAFIFINSKGQKQAGRYQIIPVGGSQYLDDATAKAKSPSFQRSTSLDSQLFQVPSVATAHEAGDQTNDSSEVWPDSRKTIELGIITINSVVRTRSRLSGISPSTLRGSSTASNSRMTRRPPLRSHVHAYR
jgi:catalase